VSLVDYPLSFRSNILERPSEINRIKTKLRKRIFVIFHSDVLLEGRGDGSIDAICFVGIGGVSLHNVWSGCGVPRHCHGSRQLLAERFRVRENSTRARI
jgi:hypothetical protein